MKRMHKFRFWCNSWLGMHAGGFKEFCAERVEDFNKLGFETTTSTVTHERKPDDFILHIECTDEERTMLIELFMERYSNFDYFPPTPEEEARWLEEKKEMANFKFEDIEFTEV